MESILSELYFLWNEQGEMPRGEALRRKIDRLHELTEGRADSEPLWDACMDYACLLEQQAFEMGFVWSAALRGEMARLCPPPVMVHEKSPASSA